MAPATMKQAPMEDQSLVAATLAGDRAAFQALVERYQARLFGLVRHYLRNPVEVEDIVQETFLKAFTRLSSFQQSSAFYTWLYRIAVNTILDQKKRKSRSPIQPMAEPEELGAPSSEAIERMTVRPEARLERQEIADITHGVLAELPEIFRTVLVMREFEGLAYQEIADVLEISIGTVESRLFRARARFKQKLLQLHPEFALEEGS
ncbi:MAG: sigma-70 family RNA polymerase sigma factor [Planctomycetota bacterium]